MLEVEKNKCQYSLIHCGGCLWSVCCWWLVYSLTWPESDWLDSGWVRLHTCGAWAIMAPRINQPSTHTLEEEPQSWSEYHQLGEYHQPVKLQINILYNIYPCPVSEGPKGKPLQWRVEEQPSHISNACKSVNQCKILNLKKKGGCARS